MSDNTSNNKRLAKNTLLLYLRMLFLMVVSLYTSRVTLNVLGVDDFGVYNIVGGVVVLFSFLSTSLNIACNRFLSVAVAQNDIEIIQRTFSTALVAHFFLTIVVLFLLETIGLWFIGNKINVPEGSESVAIIVYHIAVITVCFNIIRTPFNSSIIANEKMDFFAYSSIAEGVLKLGIVFGLLVIPFNKLIMYSVLMMLSVVVINIWFIIFCTKKLKGNKLILIYDNLYMKKMLSFSGWNLIGGVADIGWQQGTNIILNMFFGVTLNATMGITNQIRNAVYSFVSNLQMAANPQIIKAYATKEYEHFHSLIYSISKYSFYLMLFFSIPLIANIDYVLKLWLGNPPEFSSNFAILILIFSTIGALGGPLWVCIQATGDVKKYSIFVSCILLLNVPATYILFVNNYPPESMLYARIIINIIQLIWCVLYAKSKVNLSLCSYLYKVLFPILAVTVFSAVPTFFVSYFFETDSLRLICTSVTSTLILFISIYFVGISKSERKVLNSYIIRRFNTINATNR